MVCGHLYSKEKKWIFHTFIKPSISYWKGIQDWKLRDIDTILNLSRASDIKTSKKNDRFPLLWEA